jgi:hypothetical protein
MLTLPRIAGPPRRPEPGQTRLGVEISNTVCLCGLNRAAPVFPVRDLRASLAFYERLGFVTREYRGFVEYESQF